VADDLDPRRALRAKAQHLAAQRQERERSARERADRQQQTASNPAAARRRLRAAVGRYATWVMAVAGLVAVLFGTASCDHEVVDHERPTLRWGCLACIAIVLVALVWRLTSRRRLDHWLARRPFRILQLPEVLSLDRAIAEIEIVLAFAGDAPETSVVGELLASAMPVPESEPAPKLDGTPGKLTIRHHLDSGRTNHACYAWFRRLAVRVLADIHAAHPIGSATVRVVDTTAFAVPSGPD
jgi:hypothetical protein